MASILGAGGLPPAQAKVNKTQNAPIHDFKGEPNLPNQERRKMIFDDGKAEPAPANEDKIASAFIVGFLDELEKAGQEENPLLQHMRQQKAAPLAGATSSAMPGRRMYGAKGPATPGSHLIFQEAAHQRQERRAAQQQEQQAAAAAKAKIDAPTERKNPQQPWAQTQNIFSRAPMRRQAAQQRLSAAKVRGLFKPAFFIGLFDEMEKIAVPGYYGQGKWRGFDEKMKKMQQERALPKEKGDPHVGYGKARGGRLEAEMPHDIERLHAKKSV